MNYSPYRISYAEQRQHLLYLSSLIIYSDRPGSSINSDLLAGSDALRGAKYADHCRDTILASHNRAMGYRAASGSVSGSQAGPVLLQIPPITRFRISRMHWRSEMIFVTTTASMILKATAHLLEFRGKRTRLLDFRSFSHAATSSSFTKPSMPTA